MALFQNIDVIIYDLDGTIIDTERFHQQAWELTSRDYGFGFSGEQLYVVSKGISSKRTLEKMLPVDRYGIIAEAAETKFRYMMDLMEHDTIEMLPGFEETFEQLQSYHLKIGICTSARKENVAALQRNTSSPISTILNYLEGKVAWKEMFTQGKPTAEPLLLSLNLLGGIFPDRALYVGDAAADYGCAQNAGTSFVYFCPDGVQGEKEIPADVLMIHNHRELLEYLK
ncbi:MAG: HAD hydrolase-like protein [Nanoarchaeota archaeon]|nr:HAD hydrolase-like protein [Nanoarchaeota archaeon]